MGAFAGSVEGQRNSAGQSGRDSGALPDGIVDGDDVQRIDDVADAILVKEGNFFRSERDEISLRDDEPPSVRQLNRKRLEPVGQAFLDVVDNHLVDTMTATAASQCKGQRAMGDSAQIRLARGQAEFAARGGVRRVGRGPEKFGGELDRLPALLDGVDQRLALHAVLLGIGVFVGLQGVRAGVGGAFGFDLSEEGGVEAVGRSRATIQTWFHPEKRF